MLSPRIIKVTWKALSQLLLDFDQNENTKWKRTWIHIVDTQNPVCEAQS